MHAGYVTHPQKSPLFVRLRLMIIGRSHRGQRGVRLVGGEVSGSSSGSTISVWVHRLHGGAILGTSGFHVNGP